MEKELVRATDLQAERHVLGCVMYDNAAFFEAQRMLSAKDFGSDTHRIVCRTMAAMLEEGTPIDETTLTARLRADRQLESIGGRAVVFDLTDGLPRGRNVLEYARIVRNNSKLRELQQVAHRTAAAADGTGLSGDELREHLEAELLSLAGESDDLGAVSMADDLDALLASILEERARPSELLGLGTGIEELDRTMLGYQAGEIAIIGADSGVGKTSLLAQTVLENCPQGTPVLIFSLEMSRAAFLRRLVCAVSGVPFPRVRDPKWASADELERIARAADAMKGWPLYILDDAGMSIERLGAMARLYIRRRGVKLVGVDYVQIVSAQGRDERGRVTAVSRGLTTLAKAENVAVVALSQLSRADKAAKARKPVKSDLRESSQLENDAHTIILLYRKWDEAENKLASDGELIVAKQRNGETGSIPALYNRGRMTFGPVK